MMGFLFKDDLHDRLGTWPLGLSPYGGTDQADAPAGLIVDGFRPSAPSSITHWRWRAP